MSVSRTIPIFRTALARHWSAFTLSVAFLTRIPMPACMMTTPDKFPLSLGYFPVTGAIVGLLGAGITLGAALILPLPLAILLGMVSTILLTGSFHEDGLADCCDGLIGGHDPATRLEIMKDSRIGTHGTVGLWAILSAKFLLLFTLFQHDSWLGFLLLISAHSLGRASSLLLIATMPYVQDGPSKARPFLKTKEPFIITAGILFAVSLSAALAGNYFLPVNIAMALCSWGCSWYFYSKIGGMTGDCLGSANQLSEVACYASVVIILHLAF